MEIWVIFDRKSPTVTRKTRMSSEVEKFNQVRVMDVAGLLGSDSLIRPSGGWVGGLARVRKKWTRPGLNRTPLASPFRC